MKRTEVKNQTELETALNNKEYPVCIGDAFFDLPSGAKADATDSSTVRAYGSSTVRAYDSSTVRATDSSTVRAYGSSTVRATDSSTVTAYGSSTVTAYDSSTVRAGRFAAIHIKSDRANIEGGVQIRMPKIETALDWCDVYGVEVNDGIATVYKGVNDDYRSPRGGQYTPGTTPQADDWDGGREECGGGLHFSPTAGHTLAFYAEAKRFLACPVALSDIAIHKNPMYPDKIKAKGLAAPCYEVDIHGHPVKTTETKAKA